VLSPFLPQKQKRLKKRTRSALIEKKFTIFCFLEENISGKSLSRLRSPGAFCSVEPRNMVRRGAC
jgi:hypothetical protein